MVRRSTLQKHTIPPRPSSQRRKLYNLLQSPMLGLWREQFLRDCSQEHTAPAKSPCGRVRAQVISVIPKGVAVLAPRGWGPNCATQVLVRYLFQRGLLLSFQV